ncbi:hypothetical protein V6O07_05750, partial [Arthrospira platensis SPKY2]
SISQENTFAEDVASRERLHREILAQAQSVSRRLKQQKLAGSTVKLKLRWPDFTTLTRQTTLAQPTDSPQEIAQVALALLDAHRPAQQAVRLIGVGISGLLPPMRQMTLFDLPDEREERLSHALESLRQRFGADVVRRASDL